MRSSPAIMAPRTPNAPWFQAGRFRTGGALAAGAHVLGQSARLPTLEPSRRGGCPPLVPPDEAMCSGGARNVAATRHRHLPVEVEEPQPGRLEATHHDGRKALHQRIAENWVGLQLGTETLGVDLYSAGAAIAPYAYSQKKPRLRRRSSRSSTRLQTCRFAYDQIGVL